jgi:hypothetical protein
MKNILFIHPGQFGYHTPTYYYCLLLQNKYNITYIGMDENRETKEIVGIKYRYLSGGQAGLANKINYFKLVRKELKESKYDFILVNYFPLCSILQLFTKSSTVVEIRTSYIFTNILKRIIYNFILVLETRLFKNVTTISGDLAKSLFLPKRTYIIPLGAPKFPEYSKNFDYLSVLYVGTFYGREIPNTIFAFAKFVNDLKLDNRHSYSIIGFGSEKEVAKIKSTIIELNMENHIFYKGVIRYPELTLYFEKCNIGMSYIPMKRRYDSQPPIKSIEYLLSGMAVLATGTKENVKIINEKNGIISRDSIDDIYNGLKNIYNSRKEYNSIDIQKDASEYSWNYIIDNRLIPYIESF